MEEEIMSKKLLLIMLLGICIGCTTTAGRKFDAAAGDRIEVGQTTEAEVFSMLGVPLWSQQLSNGSYIYDYSYGHSWPLDVGTKVETLQVQFYDAVVIDKWQRLAQY
jgi:hypothetical protein